MLTGLALVALVLAVERSAAQTSASVRISPPDTDGFPTVTFFLSTSDGEGRRLTGLGPSNIEVLENGLARPANRVDEIEVGTRQLFVINTNESMAVRDSRGRSRFHFVREALLNWWSRPAASRFAADDLTVIAGGETLLQHSPSAATASATLDQFQPTFDEGTTDFSLLLDSLSYLEDPGTGQGAPSFVIFLTPLIRAEAELALANTISRASELGAVIFPVLIDNPEAVQEDSFGQLEQLAAATGGSVFLLDRTEPQLPALADRVLSQRTQYRVSYQSLIDTGGSHEISARVSTQGLIAQSAARSFDLRVEPPQVAFVQPPSAITRQSTDAALPLEQLPPTSQTVRLLITFPDGHRRPLERSQLLVDGELVVEQTEPPYDAFSWDLRPLDQSADLAIQAIVTDSLGLEARSLPHTVALTVVPPPTGLAALRPALGPLLTVLAVLIAGIVAALLLYTYSGRSSPADGELATERVGTVRTLERARLQPARDAQTEAVLIPYLESGEPGEPMGLTGVDLTLGRDASLAAYPLSDPSVSGLHARLIRQAGGHYLLRDQGSVAGTWVNFERVPAEGIRLRDGDVIQLGRVSLRFQLRRDSAAPEIRVVPLGNGEDRADRGEEAS